LLDPKKASRTFIAVLAKHPNIVLLHVGTANGTERIVACWAVAGKIPQVVFTPDRRKHAKVAPFKRSDQLLQTVPGGVIVFRGRSSPRISPRRRACF
jgi:hypothetical protein